MEVSEREREVFVHACTHASQAHVIMQRAGGTNMGTHRETCLKLCIDSSIPIMELSYVQAISIIPVATELINTQCSINNAHTDTHSYIM